MIKRFEELNPEFGALYADSTPERGGFNPTGEYDLSFTCPKCGVPYRVCIRVGPTANEARSCWAAYPLPGMNGWKEHLSIAPSINYTKCGHGPKHPQCSFHGTVHNGGFIFA